MRFIEGIHNPKLRGELPEVLIGIPYIKIKERKDSNASIYDVDGYYQNIKRKDSIRQIRQYEAHSFEEATEKAKIDGLVMEIMVELLLTEETPCNLERDLRLH